MNVPELDRNATDQINASAGLGGFPGRRRRGGGGGDNVKVNF